MIHYWLFHLNIFGYICTFVPLQWQMTWTGLKIRVFFRLLCYWLKKKQAQPRNILLHLQTRYMLQGDISTHLFALTLLTLFVCFWYNLYISFHTLLINQFYCLKRRLSGRNSNPKTLGSIPGLGRLRDSFSIPPSQLLCRLCLCLTPLSLYGTHPNLCLCAYLCISICCKRVGFTDGVIETGKHCTQEIIKLGCSVLWLLTFRGESSPNFLCIALGQDIYLI